MLASLSLAAALGSSTIPVFLEQPGSRPGATYLEPARNCDSCHADYDPAIEPAGTWKGSLMANAARDPLMWAALAVAEQDFVPDATVWANLMPATTPDSGGAGDLCLRCHAPTAWIDRRSTPTSGAALAGSDFDGVGCDACHRAIDPVSALGRSLVEAGREPWWTNPRTSQTEGFYGGAQYVLELDNTKRGPYDNATAFHGFEPLAFQREGELCGTCHDVSNPITGALAPNSGRLDSLALGSRAAFDNPPYAYGVIERTYSEWRSSRWPVTPTTDFPTLPRDLRWLGGAPDQGFRAAPYSSSSDPQWNPPRTYTCQTCHLAPATGKGSNDVSPVRTDLPVHDLTGANVWALDAILWLDGQGRLRGGALDPGQRDAILAARSRARRSLERAAWLEARRSTDRASLIVRTVNLTGHKFPTGYPEGRRAWLNLRIYDALGNLLEERGRYDPAAATLARDTRVFEVKMGMRQDWAARLLSYGYDPAFPLTYRGDGTVEWTLADLAAGIPAAELETFHFVLNNAVVSDNRIPPWGMDPTLAAERQCTPVPAAAYPPLIDGTFRFWDELSVPLPAGAARAEIALLHQIASREYIDFLRHANRSNQDGQDLYDAWLATGMSPPERVAYAEWRADACSAPPQPARLSAVKRGQVELSWAASFDASFYRLYRHTRADRSDPPAWIELSGLAQVDAVLDDGRGYHYDLRPASECGEAAR